MELAGVGGSVFGLGAFLTDVDFPFIPQHQSSLGRRRSAFGFNALSSRVYTRSYNFTLQPKNIAETGGVGIGLESITGALLGRIRTDIEFPIIESLTFVVDENGSADFSLKLSDQPDLPLLPMAMVQINIGNSSFNWFKGIITAPDIKGTRDQLYEFKGFGLRRYFETLQANVTYLAGQDVSDIIKDLIQTWVIPYCPIKYNESKIDSPTGVVLANDIILGKFTLRKVFDTLREMSANTLDESFFQWGVDGEGEFYWTRLTQAVQKTLLVGYDVNEFDPTDNYDNIKNAIFIQRQQGLAGDGAGWAAAYTVKDDSSVAKYGRNELTFQIPGFFGDDEAKLIGDSLLAAQKDPVQSAKISNYEVLGEKEFFGLGVYRVIMPFDKYTLVESDVDNQSEWTKTGSGDLAKFNDSNFYVWGERGVRFEATTAMNDRAQINLNADGIIQSLQFFVRASHSGAFFSVGIGRTVWNEHTLKIDIPASDTFTQIKWDVSNLDLRSIKKFAIHIDQNFSSLHKIWIDKIDFTFKGSLTYKLEMKRATYNFTPGKATATVEFGNLPKRLQDYVGGLIATATEFNAINEAI